MVAGRNRLRPLFFSVEFGILESVFVVCNNVSFLSSRVYGYRVELE